MAWKWWHGTLTDRRQAQVDDLKSFAHHVGERLDAEAGLGTHGDAARAASYARGAFPALVRHLCAALCVPADGKSQGSGSDRDADLECGDGKLAARKAESASAPQASLLVPGPPSGGSGARASVDDSVDSLEKGAESVAQPAT